MKLEPKLETIPVKALATVVGGASSDSSDADPRNWEPQSWMECTGGFWHGGCPPIRR